MALWKFLPTTGRSKTSWMVKRQMLPPLRWPVAFATTLLAVVAGFSAAGGVNEQGRATTFDFRGEAVLATGFVFAGTEVGGLSGITYDAALDVYYAISDDRSQIGPARFYTLRIDLADGRLDSSDITFVGVTTLRRYDGTLFPPLSLDPEGIALTRDLTLVVTSEGDANRLIDPFVRVFDRSGVPVEDLPLPAYFLPAADRLSGVRNNLAFESAGVPPNGEFFFTGTENALVQDGPEASLTAGSPSRLLRYHLLAGRLDRQYLYFTGPIPEPPVPVGGFATNGLVELLPLNNEFLLAMERSFSVGAGNTIRLYLVALLGADDISGVAGLAGNIAQVRPARKTLLLDLDSLGIPLDNVEGMTFGPTLPDGRRSLILVADNNFSPTQATQFLLFAVSPP